METAKLGILGGAAIAADEHMIHTTQEWKIGDCLELLPEIETGSIDMILCDLPYGCTARCDWDKQIPTKTLLKEYDRIITDNGAIVLTATQPFATELIVNTTTPFRYDIVWQKPNPSGFLNANKMPMRAHEGILIFYKHLPTYNPQMTAGMSYTRVDRKNDTPVYGKCERADTINDGSRFPISVITFPNSDRTNVVHPTQKPVALFEYLIKTYTNEGDTIHDSCLGSGTTLEACRLTNRNCFGFEISDEWEKYYPDRCMSHTPTLQSYF